MSKIKIFVSYARADLKDFPTRPNLIKASRIGGILEDIEYGLRCHDPRGAFETLRDDKGLIHVSDIIDERIFRGIEACDIGLVLMSPSYCASDECMKEFYTLLATHKPLAIVETEDVWGDTIENKMRQIRPHVDRILRAQFFSGSQKFGHPLPQCLLPAERKSYDEAVDRVVQGIETRGRDILKGHKASQGLAVEDVGRNFVFLAYPTADVRKQANILSTSLQKAGYSCLCFNPNLHLTPDGRADTIIRSAIEKCDVVIQLLGGVPGIRVNEQALVVLQYEIALASDKPFHAWRSEFDPDECGPDHGNFIKSVQCHLGSYEEFEQYTLKQLASVKRSVDAEQRRKTNISSVKVAPYIAIDVAEPDVHIANIIAEALATSADVSSLAFEIDRTKLEEAVHDNDGIIMVYAESREGQTRIGAHFPIIRKIKHRNQRINIAIGNGLPNESGSNTIFHPRGPSVHIIKIDRDQMKVDPAALNTFLDGIRANTERT